MKCNSYYRFFRNFSNKAKIDIVSALMKRPMSVNEIAEEVGEEQSTVSHNLKQLSSCHVLDVRQKGKNRIYSLNKETVIPILGLVEKHVKKSCKGECAVGGKK